MRSQTQQNDNIKNKTFKRGKTSQHFNGIWTEWD